ncbi:hypothetical protein J14TS2_37770 [Bacillus sp. J14TS2]|nr:hypothetical protein J14TS2_37770 [Bacillus sp. J14TS2]
MHRNSWECVEKWRVERSMHRISRRITEKWCVEHSMHRISSKITEKKRVEHSMHHVHVCVRVHKSSQIAYSTIIDFLNFSKN